MNADEIIGLLDLEPLEHEGGMFRQTYVDGESTAIYFLVHDGDFSAIHQLDTPEAYHYYAGDPLQLLLLYPDGTIDRPLLGNDLRAGQRPQLVVPGGVWQGSMSTGSWTLIGTTMAPPFNWNAFRLGEHDKLCADYPLASDTIQLLTRS